MLPLLICFVDPLGRRICFCGRHEGFAVGLVGAVIHQLHDSPGLDRRHKGLFEHALDDDLTYSHGVVLRGKSCQSGYWSGRSTAS